MFESQLKVKARELFTLPYYREEYGEALQSGPWRVEGAPHGVLHLVFNLNDASQADADARVEHLAFLLWDLAGVLCREVGLPIARQAFADLVGSPEFRFNLACRVFGEHLSLNCRPVVPFGTFHYHIILKYRWWYLTLVDDAFKDIRAQDVESLLL